VSLRDLFIRVGIDVKGINKLEAVNKLVDTTKKGFDRLGSTVNRFTGALTVAALGLFVEHLVTQGDALMHSAEALGITTDELQKFQYVSKQMQVPVQQVAVALRFFNRAIGEASFGGKAASKAFGRLGMSVVDAHGKVRPTDELLFEFADKLQKIPSQAQRTAIAMRTLGRGGAAMLPVLQHGSKALREMFADVEELGGGFDKDFTEKAHELVHQQARLAMGWKTMAGLLGKELFPVLTKFAENGIKTVKVLIDFAKHTFGIRTALMALPVVLGAVAAGWMVMNIAMAPAIIFVGLLVAAFTALYLIFDDLYTFVSGGDSVIGRLLDQLTGGNAKEVLDQIVKAFKAVADALSLGDTSAKSLGTTLLTAFANSVPSIVKWGGTFALFVVNMIHSAIDEAEKLGLALAWMWRGGKISEFGQLSKQMADLDKNADDFTNKMQAATRALDSLTTPTSHHAAATDADWNPLAPTTRETNPSLSMGAGSPISIVQHFNGPADPKRVQEAARDGIKSGMKDAANQNRDTHSAVNTGMPTYTTVGNGP
jgi:hypothetical protein